MFDLRSKSLSKRVSELEADLAQIERLATRRPKRGALMPNFTAQGFNEIFEGKLRAKAPSR